MTITDRRTRWLALIVLCLGDLMIVLDTTVVNVALPSIRSDLGFSETSLAWVVNAYLLTFGGFLLLGGRLGDLFGHRRLFLSGIALFTTASLACGLATTQGFLIAARAVQGFGGAVVSAVALSLIVMLFTDATERTKAMGFFGFVMAAGGSIGVLLGGVITDVLTWHWVFLINLPVGIAVFALTLSLIPAGRGQGRAKIDFAGAATITSSLMLAVYAVVNGNDAGWTGARTLGLLAVAAVLLVAFLVIESRVANPLVPLRLFKLRNVSTANVVGALWAAAMFASFFLSALYLQLVLGYGPLDVGLTFLPANVIMAVFSLGLSARVVMRFGIKRADRGRDDARRARAPALRPRAGRRQRAPGRDPGDARLRDRRGTRVQPGAARGDERRRPERGRPRVGRRQHLVHDGRRARPRPAREHRGLADGHAEGERRGRARPRSTAATTSPLRSALRSRSGPASSPRCSCARRSRRRLTRASRCSRKC